MYKLDFSNILEKAYFLNILAMFTIVQLFFAEPNVTSSSLYSSISKKYHTA